MGDLRIRHGIAYGRQNNFYTSIIAGGTSGLFAQANTAPDVTTGSLFYTNNSGATTIRDFSLMHPSQGQGNLAGLYEGKRIMVWFLDANTRYAYSTTGPIIGIGSDGLQGTNSYSEFMYHTSNWYQVDLARIANDFATYTSSNVVYGSQSSINVRGIHTAIVSNGAAANFTILTATGGEQGQELTFFANGSAFQITANTAGLANSFVTTSSTGSLFVVAASGTVSFRFIGNQWIESR